MRGFNCRQEKGKSEAILFIFNSHSAWDEIFPVPVYFINWMIDASRLYYIIIFQPLCAEPILVQVVPKIWQIWNMSKVRQALKLFKKNIDSMKGTFVFVMWWDTRFVRVFNFILRLSYLKDERQRIWQVRNFHPRGSCYFP